MDQPETGVAEELLHPVALEDPAAAGQVEGGVDDAPGAGDRDVLGSDDLDRPVGSVVDARRPLVERAIEQRAGRLERHPHLGDVVLDVRVVGHRSRERDRGAPVRALDGEVVGAPGDAQVDVREAQHSPGEDRKVERRRAGHAGRADERHPLIWHERAVEDRVLARRRPHAERVPRLLDPEALRVACKERVDDTRAGRIARVHPVQSEVRPDGREAAEGLATGEPPASLDALRARRREEQRDIVAGLAVTGGEDVACCCLLEQPGKARVTGAVELRGDPRPVEVHVDRDRGRGSDVGEPALQTSHLCERQPRPPEVGRDREVEVARAAELVEVLLEEAVGGVIARGPLIEAGEQLVGQDRVGGGFKRCHRGLLLVGYDIAPTVPARRGRSMSRGWGGSEDRREGPQEVLRKSGGAQVQRGLPSTSDSFRHA